MKYLFLFLILFINLTIGNLNAYPWDLDFETKEHLIKHIDSVHQKYLDKAVAQGKEHYLIDIAEKPINFSSKECHYCRHFDSLDTFLFHRRGYHPKAHCFGVTIFFIQYFLEHQKKMFQSCSNMLSTIAKNENFQENAHSYSMNQPGNYYYEGMEENELEGELMKEFLMALIGKRPTECFDLPLEAEKGNFEKAAIYATLKSLPNRLIFVSFAQEGEDIGHCIAISTHPKKIFLFDSSSGIYHFPNLETLSWSLGTGLKDFRFYWLAAFKFNEG